MFVLSLLARMRRWSAGRALGRDLSTMSDDELKDVGLTRGEIDTLLCGWSEITRMTQSGSKVGAVEQEQPEDQPDGLAACDRRPAVRTKVA